jgi:hypothetical protein
MRDLRKPQLGADVYEEISAAQHKVDKAYWAQLQLLRVSPRAYSANARIGEPIPPAQPIRLGHTLGDYARALFNAEAKWYRLGPEWEGWLRNLAERMETRTIETAWQANSTGTLTYHATKEEMQKAVHEALQAHLEEIMQALNGQTSGAPDIVSEPVAASQRLTITVTCPSAARKLEKYLRDKGMGFTEFAIQAQTTGRTLLRFRKTGKLRRDLFENVAKAMGTTKEELMKE